MLTNFLYASSLWFVLSFLPLIWWGQKNREQRGWVYGLYLAGTILLGDYILLRFLNEWQAILVFSAAVFLVGLVVRQWLKEWNILAIVSFFTITLTSGLYLLYTFMVTAFATANIAGYLLSLIFFFVEFSALFLSLSYAFEALDTLCRVDWKRRALPLKVKNYAPMVSLHLPAYNEPVEIIEQTLASLAKLNYENYEVLVIDNNTKDKDTYLPLFELCKKYGEKFRCFHIDQWPGYKSGALNFALSQTNPQAEIVGIIDADYLVKPNFLSDLVGHFYNSKVAFVQTPQDYRFQEKNVFFETAYYGYKYFFEVSMPSRSEHNAIIFAGTMGLLRKNALQEIGGWSEWCITEDAEASLRLLKHGYDSVYVNQSYGQGLMPLTFDAFKKQRFRWCFGGIQILKEHWEALLPWASRIDPRNKLTGAQKYYYFLGGLQWYNDLLNLFFVFFLVMGGILSLFPQIQGFRPLSTPLLLMPAIFLLVSLWRFLWVLKGALNLSTHKALVTMINFFSLGWAVTLGSIQGLVQSEGVFLRTPKIKSKKKFLHALGVTQWEIMIGVLCVGAGAFFLTRGLTVPILAFSSMLLWEGAVYLSAPAFSLLSTRRLPEKAEVEALPLGRGLDERRAAGLVFVGVAVIMSGFILWRVLPQPTKPAPYSRFQPKEIASPLKVDSFATPSPIFDPNPSSIPTPTVVPSDDENPQPTAGEGTVVVTPQPTEVPTPEPTPRRVTPTPNLTPQPTGTGSAQLLPTP